MAIFISYRRDDALTQARSLAKDLADEFGKDKIFYDNTHLKLGNKWPDKLKKGVESAQIVLVLIANKTKWLGIRDESRRIDDPDDWVRQEIETALANSSTLVIPVFFNDAQLPSSNALPVSIKDLLQLQCFNIDEKHWELDVSLLKIFIKNQLNHRLRKEAGPKPYNVFIVYARKDADYLEELRDHLRPMEHAGLLNVWCDREIDPGVKWEKAIIDNMDTADLILLMVSTAYYKSAYIHEKELKHALERHEKGEATMIPIIVRPCNFKVDSIISSLQVLPKDALPVTEWPNRDNAWLDVVNSIQKEVENRENNEQKEAEQAQKQKKEAEAEHLRRERDETDKKRRDEQAQLEAERLKREQAARQQQELQALRQADEDVWSRAQAEDQPDSYRHYLRLYPKGAHQREAADRLKTLEKTGDPGFNKKILLVPAVLLIGALAYWLFPKSESIFSGMESDKGKVIDDTLPPRNPSPEVLLDNSSLTKPVEQKSNPQIGSPTSSSTFSSDYPLVYVAGGTFTMGSPKTEKDRYNDECQHQVTVKSFQIGKYEVTQKQWKSVMGPNPSFFKGCDDCPVENVSWSDVQQFISKLNEKSSIKYRLPTEEEWEFAARGGTQSRRYVYSGGNTLSSVAWYSENSGSETHRVGAKSPNELGIHDMSGNVWEWCLDLFKPYPGCSVDDRTGVHRVTRGGGWSGIARRCRTSNRGHDEPDNRSNNVGFRLAAAAPR